MTNGLYCDPRTGKLLPERRSGSNRRGPQTCLSPLTSRFRRRKSRGRRRTDKGAYVDTYDSRTWFIAISVLTLSAVDAFMTAIHMIRGTATELNPFMAAVLRCGGLYAFFAAKAALTIFPMAVIFVHKEWALGWFAARLCLLAYGLLILYHIYLVFMLS